MSDWIAYAAQRPEAAGVYRWRIPSVAMKGRNVTFLANMRLRGAGFKNNISPEFDYWDGWKIIIPVGVEWQPLKTQPEKARSSYSDVDIEGIENVPCPFCSKIPKWKGYRTYSGGILHGEVPHTRSMVRLSKKTTNSRTCAALSRLFNKRCARNNRWQCEAHLPQRPNDRPARNRITVCIDIIYLAPLEHVHGLWTCRRESIVKAATSRIEKSASVATLPPSHRSPDFRALC